MRFEPEIAPGVHRVEDAYVNWYLLEDEQGITVIDTGHPASWRSLGKVLGRMGRSTTDLAAVALTHGHFDHMGFAERARVELGIEVWAPERERALVARPWHYEHERSRLVQPFRHPGFLKVFAAMGAAGALRVKGCTVIRPYSPGEVLDVPGRLEAIGTPGHTLGHCALYAPAHGVLFAGDAIVTFDPYTTRSGPQIVSGSATADSGCALASLSAIASCEATVLATGHGPVWRGPLSEAVDQARRRGPS